MLEFKNEYFQLETDRNLYPTEMDLSKCEVYGSKPREAFVYKIPNDRYKANAGNIDFSLYPDGIWNDYEAIKIIEKLPYFEPSVSFNKLADITASNLNKLKDEIKQHIVDIETAMMESYTFIDSGNPGQNNLPYLPDGTVWFRNGETGNIEALPVDELYSRFDNMVNKVYDDVYKLLVEDKNNMFDEMREYTDTLLKELTVLKVELANALITLHNKNIDELTKLNNKFASDLTTLTEKSKEDINSYKDETIIPSIDGYLRDTTIPAIDEHTDKKKVELNKFIEENHDKLKGDKGDTGERGEQGPVGPMGTSIKGDKGDKGDKGNDGVVVEVKGTYAFQIRDDHLFLHYTGDEEPKFYIDERGHLMKEVE